MKRFLLFITAVCGLLSLSAQITHTPSGDIDRNAEQILKKAASLFASDASNFKVTMVNRDSNKRETASLAATVTYHKGRYHVIADNQELFCDGKSVWHWNKETKETVVNTVSDSDDDLFNPGRLLVNYRKHFRAKFIRTEDDGTAVVDLIPLQTRSYHKIRLLVNRKSGVLKQMTLHNYDGTQGEYNISAFKSKVQFKESEFTYVSRQGVELIDMR